MEYGQLADATDTQRNVHHERADGSTLSAPRAVSTGVSTGASRSVLREIDRELERLEKVEKAVLSERKLLLAARAVLADRLVEGQPSRRRVSHSELAAYLEQHPGEEIEQIADALEASAKGVSIHLHRGRDTRYECRDGRWYVESRSS
jgi:DNA-directed RNA polymerase specialized sigma24 family protein